MCYGFGTMAYVRDINNLFNKTTAKLYAQIEHDGHFDKISHVSINRNTDMKIMMSYGPQKAADNIKKLAFGKSPSTAEYPSHINESLASGDLILNDLLFEKLRSFSELFPFQGLSSNCVNWASLGLWLNGIPNIGLHPFILYGSIALYNTGIYDILASQPLYNLNNNNR